MKAKLVKLSVCPCGFPLLDEAIALGTECEVNPNARGQFMLKCGGCGAVQSLRGIWVEARGDSRAGYLPESAFEVIT